MRAALFQMARFMSIQANTLMLLIMLALVVCGGVQ